MPKLIDDMFFWAITGRGGQISEMGMAVEIFHIAYVTITVIIVVKERHGQKISPKGKTDKKNSATILLSCTKLLQ